MKSSWEEGFKAALEAVVDHIRDVTKKVEEISAEEVQTEKQPEPKNILRKQGKWNSLSSNYPIIKTISDYLESTK